MASASPLHFPKTLKEVLHVCLRFEIRLLPKQREECIRSLPKRHPQASHVRVTKADCNVLMRGRFGAGERNQIPLGVRCMFFEGACCRKYDLRLDRRQRSIAVPFGKRVYVAKMLFVQPKPSQCEIRKQILDRCMCTTSEQVQLRGRPPGSKTATSVNMSKTLKTSCDESRNLTKALSMTTSCRREIETHRHHATCAFSSNA
jgi:hypothetical protein